MKIKNNKILEASRARFLNYKQNNIGRIRTENQIYIRYNEYNSQFSKNKM